jgi:hypothetical protein
MSMEDFKYPKMKELIENYDGETIKKSSLIKLMGEMERTEICSIEWEGMLASKKNPPKYKVTPIGAKTKFILE